MEKHTTNPDVLSSAVWPAVLARVSQDAAGQYTAQVIGLPDVQSRAATAEEALAGVRAILARWLSSGQLVPLALPTLLPVRKAAGWAMDDPLEQEFLQDLAQLRQDDLDRTLREYEQEGQGCSDTSSTPTT